MVAARDSLRHWAASSFEASPDARGRFSGSAVLAIPEV
jgi:hypothetical protein